MRRVTADEAAAIVGSGDTILVGGPFSGTAVPDSPMAAVGNPRGLTLLHPVGLGNDFAGKPALSRME